MKEKKCCGVYDYDGVLVPGEQLMDQYIEPVCKEATNKYGEELFDQQIKLISEKQRLELDRDVYSGEMDEIVKELAELERKIKKHFDLKEGNVLFIIAGDKPEKLCGLLRNKLGNELELINKNRFEF